MRGWMFSSATPCFVPVNAGASTSSKPRCGGSVEKSCSCMPRVSATRPAASCPIEVDVADEQLLGERRRVREHLSTRPKDDAVAVEDQLVLAAYSVHPHHESAVVGGALSDHRLPWRPLAGVIGRAVDVD